MLKASATVLVCLAGALWLVDAGPESPLFSWFPGNEIDAAMNLWLLERNLRLLLNGTFTEGIQAVFTTGAFWPNLNTLAWSDNWLVATPVYGIFRALLPPSQAFAALVAASVAANTLACVRLTRHGATHWLPRVVAAGLASWSLTVVARIGHAQLMPAFAGILAMDALLDAAHVTAARDSRWPIGGREAIAVVGWLQLQLALGFYLGVFFALACGCAGVVLTLTWWRRSGRTDADRITVEHTRTRMLWVWGSVNLLLMLVNASIYRQYAAFAQVAEPRAWAEVASMVPRAWSYGYNIFATVDRVSLPAPFSHGSSFPGPYWEHSIFPGYAFLVALLLAMRHWKVLRESKALAVLTASCGLLVLLTLGVGSRDAVWSWWRLLYEWVPGISAIRAVARVGVVLSLLASPLLAAGLEQSALYADGRPMLARWVMVATLWSVSGLSVPDDHRVSTVDYERRRTAASERLVHVLLGQQCSAFYVAAHPGASEAEAWRWQILAMWGALESGTPTVNGYSGHLPDGGWSTVMDPSALDRYLEGKGISRGRRARVCWIPPDDLLPR